MSKEIHTIKFQVMLKQSEADAFDQYQEEHHFTSRAKAMRHLCQVGLKAAEKIARLEHQLELVSKRNIEVERSLNLISNAIKVAKEQA